MVAPARRGMFKRLVRLAILAFVCHQLFIFLKDIGVIVIDEPYPAYNPRSDFQFSNQGVNQLKDEKETHTKNKEAGKAFEQMVGPLDARSNPLLIESKSSSNFDSFGFNVPEKQKPTPGPMKPVEVKAPALLPATELARDLEMADLEVNNAPLPELEDLKFEPEPAQESNDQNQDDYEEDKLEPASKFIATQAPNLMKDTNSGAMIPVQPKRSDFGYNNPGAYKQAMHEWRNQVKSIRSSSRGAYKLDTSADAFAGLALKSLGDKPEEEAKEGNEIPAENSDNYLPNLDEKCPDWDVDYTSKIKPMLNLDTTKFLTPVLTYGPNNQLRGFRETVWLAVRLNRTIVVPPFFKHDRTDALESTGKGSVIPPVHRLSINALRKLVPVVHAQDMGPMCNTPDAFDVFFNTRLKLCSSNKMTRINNMISWMEMNEKHYEAKKGECNLDTPMLPTDTSVFPAHGPIRMPAGADAVKAIYGSSAACALWLFPYHTVGFNKVLDYDLSVNFEDLENSPEKFPNWENGDISLMASIVQFTPRPFYVQEIGKEVLTRMFGGWQEPYLAMHWRYDKDDWVLHCHRPAYLTSTTCKVVLSALEDVVDTGQKIVGYISELLKEKHFVGIYIAAPLDAAPLINTIRSTVAQAIPNFQVKTGDDSLPIVQSLYPECSYIKENIHDVFSLVDMEICSRSSIFLRSGGSSWSLNVSQERHVRGVDHSDKENLEILSGGKLDVVDLEEDV